VTVVNMRPGLSANLAAGSLKTASPLPPLRETILSISENGEVAVIQKVECFRTNNN
jgi:hypothetical protein